MKRGMAILMALTVVVFGIGCPPMDEPDPPEPTNSVSIENRQSFNLCSATPSETDLIAVEVTLSGSSNPPVNLIVPGDPISNDDAQGFCCFADGVYDVTVRTATDSATAFNNVFEGPMTNFFLALGSCGNLSSLRPNESR